MKSVLDMAKAAIFFHGVASAPRLNHPEGIAIDREGNIWCGGEEGEIFRINAAGTQVQLMGKTDGFALGIALDSSVFLYMCDMTLGCVFRLNRKTRELAEFARGGPTGNMVCPNCALVDERRGYLYVSDSRMKGPGIWRFRLDTGEGDLWFAGDCVFANGLAMHPDGHTLYVVETYAGMVSKIAIARDGSPGTKERVLTIPDTVPDGLAFDKAGRLYISCYEPSAIYRYGPDDRLELLLHDKQCLALDHPTNMAFRADHELFCANLGANHISLIDLR